MLFDQPQAIVIGKIGIGFVDQQQRRRNAFASSCHFHRRHKCAARGIRDSQGKSRRPWSPGKASMGSDQSFSHGTVDRSGRLKLRQNRIERICRIGKCQLPPGGTNVRVAIVRISSLPLPQGSCRASNQELGGGDAKLLAGGIRIATKHSPTRFRESPSSPARWAEKDSRWC